MKTVNLLRKKPFRLYSAVTGCLLFSGLFSGCATQEMQELRDNTLKTAAAAAVAQEIPYHVKGVTYYPLRTSKGFTQEGLASWYGPNFHGKHTSSKEVYDMDGMTAAHKVLPLGTLVKVINLENGLNVVVRINDRGPFSKKRVIDLSRQAAKKLGIYQKGTARVRLIALNFESVADTAIAENEPAPPETYAVQVAVYKDPDNIGKIERKLKDGRVEPYIQNGVTMYRVIAGNYTGFEEARKYRDKVRKLGYREAFVVAND